MSVDAFRDAIAKRLDLCTGDDGFSGGVSDDIVKRLRGCVNGKLHGNPHDFISRAGRLVLS